MTFYPLKAAPSSQSNKGIYTMKNTLSKMASASILASGAAEAAVMATQENSLTITGIMSLYDQTHPLHGKPVEINIFVDRAALPYQIDNRAADFGSDAFPLTTIHVDMTPEEDGFSHSFVSTVGTQIEARDANGNGNAKDRVSGYDAHFQPVPSNPDGRMIANFGFVARGAGDSFDISPSHPLSAGTVLDFLLATIESGQPGDICFTHQDDIVHVSEARLQTIPEPSTLALLGFCAATLMRRRRDHSPS